MATMTETGTAVELVDLQFPTKAVTDTPNGQSQTTLYRLRSNESDTGSASNILPPSTPTLQTFLAIFIPAFGSFISSFTSGIITVGLPTIARSINLERSLYLWPSSVYGLTSGAALLIAGSIADIVGARPVELIGITLLGVFSLSCGFAQTGAQLVAFRALQGIALAMHLPASVAIITKVVPSGRARNLGFACLGFSQPLGFAGGLVLSGVIIEKAGWRAGFYLSGGLMLAVSMAAMWTLPKLKAEPRGGAITMAKRVLRDIDWIGGLISSGGLAMLTYALA